MFSLICVWINGWVNSSEAGDLRRHRGHYDVNVMVNSQAHPWLRCHVQYCAILWSTTLYRDMSIPAFNGVYPYSFSSGCKTISWSIHDRIRRRLKFIQYKRFHKYEMHSPFSLATTWIPLKFIVRTQMPLCISNQGPVSLFLYKPNLTEISLGTKGARVKVPFNIKEHCATV